MAKDYEEPPSIPQLLKINCNLGKVNRQLQAENEKLDAQVTFLSEENHNLNEVDALCEGLKDENKRLKEENRWIPVSEGLPEKGQFCHLYMPEFNSNCPQMGRYLPDKKVWLTCVKSHFKTRKVTHWKPIILPKQALKEE